MLLTVEEAAAAGAVAKISQKMSHKEAVCGHKPNVNLTTAMYVMEVFFGLSACS